MDARAQGSFRRGGLRRSVLGRQQAPRRAEAPDHRAAGRAAIAPLVEVPLLLAPALAIVYGIFVEIDDGERKAKTPPAAAA